jgi:predicted permease
MTEALSGVPGVTAVAHSDYGLLSGNVNVMRLGIEGYRPERPSDSEVKELVVTPGFLRAAGTPLVAGRDFIALDTQQPIHTAIVNQAFARRFFNGQSPVGRHFGFGKKDSVFEIVGVAGNQHYDGPLGEVEPFYYLPAEITGPTVYVRTAQPPGAMLTTIRRVVEEQAPGVPVEHLQSMDVTVDLALGDETRIARLAGFFATIAILLAAMGLYGVMAYSVARRTREIGIRLALGARRGAIVRMVIREIGLVIAAGLLIGLPSAVALAAVIRSQFHNVSPMNPLVIAVAAACVAAVALVAGLFPARRATRVDPIRALRWE